MKTKKIIFVIVIGICMYFLYLYAHNSFNNVCLTITNNSAPYDSVYIDVYWDNEKVGGNIYIMIPIESYKFNVLPGKHTVKVKGENFEEEFTFFVFLFKYINLDYYGPNSSYFEKDKSLFIVRESFTPLLYD